MRKIEILAYIEDDVLSVGIRSLEPHDELTMFDGEYHYTYKSVDYDSQEFIIENIKVESTDRAFFFFDGKLLIGIADDTKTFNYEISI
jgi:hypothetical protein